MKKGITKNISGIGFLLIAVVFYAAAFPPIEWMSLAWLVPIPLLLGLNGLPPRRRFWYLFWFGYVGSALVVYWLTALFGMLTVILWMIPAYYVGFWGFTAMLYTRTSWQRIAWPATCWVGIEMFRCEWAPMAFSFGGLGSSQANWLGFSIASVIGVYGLSGAMVLVAALGVETWRNRNHWPGLVRYSVAALLIVCTSIAILPPEVLPPGQKVLGYALLQQRSQDEDVGELNSLPEREDGLSLIVWPELTFMNDPRLRASSWFMDLMKQDARRSKWGVLFGAIDFTTEKKVISEPFHNSVFHADINGDIKGMAGKNQPVQLMTDGLPAPDVVVMQMADIATSSSARYSAGVGVCYDGCFQTYSRRMVAKGADFLVFPTLNLEAWGSAQHRQHQRMFQMRAAETGRTVLTAAVSGPTFAAGPTGSIIAKAVEFNKTDTVKAPIIEGFDTMFDRGGWLAGPVLFGVFLAGLIWKFGLYIKAKFSKREIDQKEIADQL